MSFDSGEGSTMKWRKEVNKDFGCVSVGETCKKTLEVFNNSQAALLFVVYPEDPAQVSSLVFKITPLEVKVAGGDKGQFSITCAPWCPHVYTLEHYHVVVNHTVDLRLNLSVQALGPEVSASRTKLCFLCVAGSNCSQQQVELSNNSIVPAKFVFDLEDSSSVFQVSEPRAIVPAGGKLIFKFYFRPRRPGAYREIITCVFQFQINTAPLSNVVFYIASYYSKRKGPNTTIILIVKDVFDIDVVSTTFQAPIVFYLSGVYQPDPHINFPQPLRLEFPGYTSKHQGFEAYMECLRQLTTKQTTAELNLEVPGEQDEDVAELSGEEMDKKVIERIVRKIPKYVTDDKELMERSLDGLHLVPCYLDCCRRQSVIGATTLRNNTLVTHYFMWDLGVHSGIFIPAPLKGIIIPKEFISFDIDFTPVTEKLYHTRLHLQVFPYVEPQQSVDSPSIDLPTTLTLDLTGSGFMDTSCGWIPQCHVTPRYLMMPPCMPEQLVHATLLLQRSGHLPCTYRLEPPPGTSNFLVRPPLGYLSVPDTVLVVEFNSFCKPEGLFTEEWTIIFNDSVRYQERIQLSASVELPRVMLGVSSDQSITLTSTPPGAETAQDVPVKNPTRLHLRYRLITDEDSPWLKVPIKNGVVKPGQEEMVEVLFKPTAVQEYTTAVVCRVFATNNSMYYVDYKTAFSGSCVAASVQVGTQASQCDSSRLFTQAIPDHFDFGECKLGVKRTFTFELRNLSSAVTNFRLFPNHRAYPVGDPMTDVELKPYSGILKPHCCHTVQVSVTPHLKEILQYAVECQILQTPNGLPVVDEPPRRVFRLRIEGVMPCVQVVDLGVEGGGPLFSPDWLWRMLNINKLNEALLKVMPGEERHVRLRMPEAMVEARTITITLLLLADCTGPVSINIKRRVLCSCPLQFRDVGISLREKFYDCPHRRSMSVNPLALKFQRQGTCTLDIKLDYELIGSCEQEWNIYLSDNRKVVLSTQVVGLSFEEPSCPSLYLEPELFLKDTLIGSLSPPTQLFWLYNNTIHESCFVLDKLALREQGNKYSQVFDCKNPCAVIPAFSCVPIIISFRPVEMILYSATITLCLSEEIGIPLSLQGSGVIAYEPFKDVPIEQSVPCVSLLPCSSVPVVLSVNQFNINSFPANSKVERLFLLTNQAAEDIWIFHWHEFNIDKIVRGQVEPGSGRLLPGQSVQLKLILNGGCLPSFLSISLPCDVVNDSALRAHDEAVYCFEELKEKVKDHFTITEKGITYEEPMVEIPPRPPLHHVFITICTTVISCSEVDTKIPLRRQLQLQSYKELQQADQPLVCCRMVPLYTRVLEKTLWRVVLSPLLRLKVERTNALDKPVYHQVLPEVQSCQMRLRHLASAVPARNFIQMMLSRAIADTTITGTQ